MSDRDSLLSRREAVWDRIHLLAVFLILLCYLFFILSPQHIVKVEHLLINPLTIALVAIAASRYRGRFPWEMIPSFAFALWYYCVRAINGDAYLLQANSDIQCVAILLAWVVFYGTPFFFASTLREKMASLLAHAMLTAFGLLAWASVGGYLAGQPLQSPFPTPFPLGLGSDGRLWAFHFHPNMVAAQGTIALFCGVYLITRTRRKGLWALYGLMMLGIYLMLPLTDSRTAFVMVSVGAGLLAFLIFFRHLKQMKTKLPVGLAAMMLTVILVFLSFSGVFGLMKQAVLTLSDSRSSVEVAESPVALTEEPAESPVALTEEPASAAASSSEQDAEVVVVAVERNILEDLPNLTRRTEIYQALGVALQARPEILWKGSLSETAMDEVNAVSSWYGVEMHNSFLQTLLVMGVPGFFTALCFLAILLFRSLRLFFAKPDAVPISAQIWIILIGILLMGAMVESYLFMANNTVNLMFFFAAGMVIAQTKEKLPPPRLRGKETP